MNSYSLLFFPVTPLRAFLKKMAAFEWIQPKEAGENMNKIIRPKGPTNFPCPNRSL